MSGTVLYIVDMQPGYPGSFNIIDEVIREINLAKRRDDVVAFVTLMADSGYGKTHPQLLDTARAGGYQKVLQTTKNGADGSNELMALLAQNNTTPRRVRVVGVNRGACVFNTVQGLIGLPERKFKIEVVCDATSDSFPLGQHKWDNGGWAEKHYAEFAKHGNVKLLRI